MTTRGQILLQKLYERDAANPDQRTRFSSTIVEFTPASPDPIVALVKGDSVQAFLAKHEATRPKEHMAETKQSIWARISTAAAAVALSKAEDGITLTPEAATSAYLEQNPDEYAAWKAAPWAETVQKAEDLNTVDWHLAAAHRKLKAERKAGLEKIAKDLQADADAHTAKKAAKV